MPKFLFALLLLLPGNIIAQIAAKFIQIRPTGEFGIAMKKQLTGELLYLEDFEDRVRIRAGISYADFKSRLDTFPIYNVRTGGSEGPTVTAGYDTFEKFNMALIFGGIDVNVLNSEKIFLYPGTDILFGSFGVNRRTVMPSLYDETFSGGLAFGGLRFRAGAEFLINEHLGILLEASRSFYLAQEMGALSHNDFGIGTHIIF